MKDALMDEITELTVVSSLDRSPEKSLFWHPEDGTCPPLLVGLHTWSHDRRNQVENVLPSCQERGWALLLPEFRGPNLTTNPRAPQACASSLAKQDILDAVDHVTSAYLLDAEQVFLLGGSGGGHMALMMAAYAPERWTAVSAWVPITDLAAWHGENPSYASHVAACCGGVPGASPEVNREYRERSPLFQVGSMAAANLSIHHGRYDSSVPYTQTWRLANALETAGADRLFIEIFDGGHEIRCDVAFRWFDAQLERRRGAAQRLTG